MRGAARTWTMTAVLTALLPAACQLVAGLEVANEGGEAADAAADGDAASATPPDSVPPACRPEVPDAAAPDATPGGALTVELVFSYYTSSTYPSVDGGIELCETSGFDLDSLACEAPCRVGCNAGADAGIDNAGGDLFSVIPTQLLGTASDSNLDPIAGLERGAANVMLRVSKYNGEAEDAEVDVQLLALSGIASDTRPLPDASVGGAAVDASSWNLPWDRQSLRAWYVDPNTFEDSVLQFAKVRATGFVGDGVLVVHTPSIPMSFGSIRVDIEHATLTGELRNRGGRWSLVRGRIGGEVTKEALLDTIRAVPSDPAVCKNLTFVERYGVCDRADRGYPGAPCDAFSVGMSFTMVEGRIATLRMPSTNRTRCATELCQ